MMKYRPKNDKQRDAERKWRKMCYEGWKNNGYRRSSICALTINTMPNFEAYKAEYDYWNPKSKWAETYGGDGTIPNGKAQYM